MWYIPSEWHRECIQAEYLKHIIVITVKKASYHAFAENLVTSKTASKMKHGNESRERKEMAWSSGRRVNKHIAGTKVKRVF